MSDNATDVSSLYNASGDIQSLLVHVPGPPTGIVFYGGMNFVVSDGGANSGAARFLFATEDGTIMGWSPAVPPPAPSQQAFVVVDNAAGGAIYKGLAVASTDSGDRLYATDFHNARVDVFDGSFGPVNVPGAFVDPKMTRQIAELGGTPLAGSAADFGKLVADETEKWGKVIRAANVKPE